jgi:hypothetical protein
MKVFRNGRIVSVIHKWSLSDKIGGILICLFLLFIIGGTVYRVLEMTK